MPTFEIMHQSWSKRRNNDPSPVISNVQVSDFKLIDNHECKVHVTIDNTHQTLDGRVCFNCTYSTDGVPENGRWTVQGINSSGSSVLLKVVL